MAPYVMWHGSRADGLPWSAGKSWQIPADAFCVFLVNDVKRIVTVYNTGAIGLMLKFLDESDHI